MILLLPSLEWSHDQTSIRMTKVSIALEASSAFRRSGIRRVWATKAVIPTRTSSVPKSIGAVLVLERDLMGSGISSTAHLTAAPSGGSAAAKELEHNDNDGDHQQ